MNKQEYNGWHNYETWACNLWHDAGWENESKEAMEQAIEEHGENNPFTVKEQATLILSEIIKSYVEDNIPPEMSVASFYSDLINSALSEINYYEIAEHYINDFPLYVAMWNLPGCLPEMEPVYFLDEDEARQFLADEIENAYDNEEESPTLEEELEDKKDAIMRGEIVSDDSGYVYTVTKV
jgi:hypothetical protein